MLQFEKRAVPPPDAAASEIRRGGTRGQAPRDIPVPTASVSFVVPGAAEVVLHGAKGKVEHVKASGTVELTPGPYRMELRDYRGVVINRRKVTIDPGPQVMDLVTAPVTPLRQALLTTIPGAHQHGVVDFSESLGPTPDQGMDLWLALIGAARIIGASDFSKLGPLPLATFDDPEMLRDLVTRLTRRHEARVGTGWQVSDAPEDYLARMLRGITGLRIPVASMEGRTKLSQNRKPEDQASVTTALGASPDPKARDVAKLMGASKK